VRGGTQWQVGLAEQPVVGDDAVPEPVMGDRRVSALQDTQPDAWQAEYTQELIDLLNVLGLAAELEPLQARLLAEICEGSLITVADLYEAQVILIAPKDREVPQSWRYTQDQEATLLW
jgi:hypothetical protein